jgi:hypothetical protein
VGSRPRIPAADERWLVERTAAMHDLDPPRRVCGIDQCKARGSARHDQVRPTLAQAACRWPQLQLHTASRLHVNGFPVVEDLQHHPGGALEPVVEVERARVRDAFR